MVAFEAIYDRVSSLNSEVVVYDAARSGWISLISHKSGINMSGPLLSASGCRRQAGAGLHIPCFEPRLTD